MPQSNLTENKFSNILNQIQCLRQKIAKYNRYFYYEGVKNAW